tara:strand:- start:853 stop:1065 length:213 start_codon:yes stop_codon:yes gene_type:complete
MKICSICKKISGTNSDHLDCLEKRRIELEDGGLKEKLVEKLDIDKDPNNLGVEIKAVLEHLTKEKEDTSE